MLHRKKLALAPDAGRPARAGASELIDDVAVAAGRVARAVGYAITTALAVLFAPGTVLLALLIAGGSLLVAGVHLLVGLPWALIAGAGVLFLLALFVALGMTRG